MIVPLIGAVLALLCLGPAAGAQVRDDTQDLLRTMRAELQAERAAREVMATELAIEREARRALEQRVGELEAARAGDGIEDQLRTLIEPGAFETAPARTSFASDFNPAIGVFADSVIEAGNASEKLGEDGDRFSLREIEMDIRAPISPWAEGVLVVAYEDAGAGETETRIEEAYIDLQAGDLLDLDTDAQAKVGRFRAPFGATNRLHTHDLIQTDRPYAVQNILGEEGIVGDGIELTLPVSHRETEDGRGRTSTAHIALVNGELLAREESALGVQADDAGVELDSDSPIFLARWSEFWELDELSDVEFGVSYLRNVGDDAVQTDAGTDIEPEIYAFDATWRSDSDESGVGGWVVQSEVIHSELDFGNTAAGDLPTGDESAHGHYIVAQRQMSPNTYAGLRYGKSDSIAGDAEVTDISPFVSWYPDEFFRIRLQGQHLDVDDSSSGDESVTRVFLQFTWNIGAHQPHPYWVNR